MECTCGRGSSTVQVTAPLPFRVLLSLPYRLVHFNKVPSWERSQDLNTLGHALIIIFAYYNLQVKTLSLNNKRKHVQLFYASHEACSQSLPWICISDSDPGGLSLCMNPWGTCPQGHSQILYSSVNSAIGLQRSDAPSSSSPRGCWRLTIFSSP